MAEEFQAEVCRGTWWSSPRSALNNSPFASNYGGCWQNDFTNMKTRSTDGSLGGCATTMSPDFAFQVTGSSPPTTTSWNETLLVNATTEESYNQTLSEILNNSTSSFGMNQEQTSNFITSSGDCTGIKVGSTVYGYPTSLLPDPEQPLYGFQPNGLDDIGKVSSMPNQQILGGVHLANKTPFWNGPEFDLNNNRACFFASKQSRFVSSMYDEKPNCPSIKSQSKEIRDLGSSMKKSSGESTFKRPRLETPSPLPTFKVRKEKLGDRVTALQQLVSPFGKTDTASVLHEAIECIKILHDQVNVLSTPYMKNGATMQGQQINDKMKDNPEGAKQQDLRSRGLCLVPVSSTFPVATETAPDYWTSSFRSTFR